jgi:CTP:phosphocholine cytidylyltransferase-like protein
MRIVLLHSPPQPKHKASVVLVGSSRKQNPLKKQISLLNKTFSNNEIIIVTGQQHEHIGRTVGGFNNVTIIENKQHLITNDLYGLGLVLQRNIEPTIFMPAGVIFPPSIFKQTNIEDSQFWLSQKKPMDLGCILTNNRIEHISWDLALGWLNIGYLNCEDAAELKKIAVQYNYHRWFLFEGINHLIENGSIFRGNLVKGNSKCISLQF